jgi:hypothetical protein
MRRPVQQCRDCESVSGRSAERTMPQDGTQRCERSAQRILLRRWPRDFCRLGDGSKTTETTLFCASRPRGERGWGEGRKPARSVSVISASSLRLWRLFGGNWVRLDQIFGIGMDLRHDCQQLRCYSKDSCVDRLCQLFRCIFTPDQVTQLPDANERCYLIDPPPAAPHAGCDPARSRTSSAPPRQPIASPAA